MASPILKFLTTQSFEHDGKVIDKVRVRINQSRGSSIYGDEYTNGYIIYIDRTCPDYDYVKFSVVNGQKIMFDGTFLKIVRKDILITHNSREHHIRMEVV